MTVLRGHGLSQPQFCSYFEGLASAAVSFVVVLKGWASAVISFVVVLKGRGFSHAESTAKPTGL
jgi:hypothetical protein